MKINLGTLSSSTILFIATLLLVYGVLYTTYPGFVVNKDTNKFETWKAIGYASVFSLLFTTIVTIVSINVDKQYAKKTKLLAATK